jgi:nucleotide-binding universal stress UspA family protein
MFTRILVPTDFSTPSDAALAYGRALAGRFSAPLHLMNVAENLFLRAVVADPRDAEASTRRRLDECLTDDDRRLGAVPVVKRSDEPADEIVSYARTAGIGLIVMGTHGRSGMAHLLIGSVAERVVRAAPCPVLTVREARLAPQTAPFTRILVATDFSGPSDAALAHARLLAAKFGASLHLLHVIEDPMVAGPFGPVSEMYVGEDFPERPIRTGTGCATGWINARILRGVARRMPPAARPMPMATACATGLTSARTPRREAK